METKIYLSEEFKTNYKYSIAGYYVVINNRIFRDGWLVCTCTSFNEAASYAEILTKVKDDSNVKPKRRVSKVSRKVKSKRKVRR